MNLRILFVFLISAMIFAGTCQASGMLYSVHNFNERELFMSESDGNNAKSVLKIKKWKGDYVKDPATNDIYYTNYGIYRLDISQPEAESTLIYRDQNSPIFSIDLMGDNILFSANTELENGTRVTRIFCVDKNGENLRSLIDSKETRNFSYPKAAKNNSFAFISYPSGKSFDKDDHACLELAEISDKGLVTRKKLFDFTYTDEWVIYGASISPDGSSAAFIQPEKPGSERKALVVYDFVYNFHSTLRESGDDVFSGYCDFKADGSSVVFSLKDSPQGTFQLYAFPIGSCGQITLQKLTNEASDVSHPHCF